MAEATRKRVYAGRVALIERIARGSQAALAQFYDLTSSQVFGLVLCMVGKQSAAEEITLQVFLSVWNRAGEYRARDATPSCWLLTMARRQAIEWLRARTRRGRDEKPALDIELFTHAVTQPQDGPEATQRRDVERALASVQPPRRAAIELAYFSGMTHRELAEHLGESTGTVKESIRLGMLQLRHALRGRQA